MENNKVVYKHKNPKTLEVFYIGCGDFERSRARYARSKAWNDYVKEHGDRIVEIVAKDLLKEDALELEALLIEEYGEKLINNPPILDETRAKQRASALGNKSSFGKKRSKESRENMSKAHLGKKDSEETKAKKSAALRGREVSKETREKIGKAHKGKIVSKETREKMRSARLRYLKDEKK